MSRPVLLSGHTLQARAVLEAVKCSIRLPDEGLATASMTLAPGAERVEIGDWLRVTTPQGGRVVMVATAVAVDTADGDAQTVEAEHVFAVLRDSLCTELNPDQEAMGAGDAVRALLSCQTEAIWQMGTCDYTQALPWSFRRTSVYDGLETITECLDDPRWVLDTDSLPFTASLVRHSSAPACEMRMARNLASVRVRRERTGMFTRLTPVGMDELDIAEVNGGRTYLEKNVGKYGVIEKEMTNPALDNPHVLRAWGQAQLDRSCEPVQTIVMTGRELSARTGLALDRLTVGTVCRAAIRGGPISARITLLEWRDAVAQPEAVTVTLSSRRRTMQSVMRRMQTEIAQTRSGGGGSGAKQKKENEKLWTSITQTQEEIALEAYRLDERIDGNVQNIARLRVTADAIEGVVQKYSYDDAGDLLEGFYSNITQNADNIELKVAKTDYNGKTIASLINIGTDSILIKSARIDLQGYVTASQLNAEFANLKSTIADSLYVRALSAKGFECSSFSFKGNGISLGSKSFVTGVSGHASGAIAVRDASGSIIGTAITGYSVSYSTDDIYYLSWE